MAVRKRSWVTKTGERREAWVVAYTDQAGTRRIATFEKKRDAEAYEAQADSEVRAGVHTAVGASITVAEAAKDWLSSVELEGRERSTLKTYREHLQLHILPRLGHEKLARLTAPRVNSFRDELLRSVSRFVINTLRTWRLACPRGEFELVFPTTRGRVIQHKSLIRSALIPAQLAAGVVTSDGKAKYTGMHALRHFYASWCINRKVDGGLELPAKVVQARLGHASIVMTLDTYGHLFPRGDDGAELAAAERALGLHTTS
jgi:hypothetical protein